MENETTLRLCDANQVRKAFVFGLFFVQSSLITFTHLIKVFTM